MSFRSGRQTEGRQQVGARYRIRFFFDYGSGTCLWSGNRGTEERFGYPIVPGQLALSPETTAELERLIGRYDRPLNWENHPEAIPWSEDECRRFNASMLRHRTLIGQERGEDYEIVNEQPVMKARSDAHD
jgi:hypothetical protein